MISSTSSVKHVALLVTAMSAFAAPFMIASVNIALPLIGQEFSLNAVLLGWVATSYLLGTAVFVIPFGKVGDIYGRKKIFLYGLVCYTLSSFLTMLAPSAGILIGLRLVQGMGGAMIYGTNIAILTSVFPTHERGKALGINLSCTYLGLSSGPFLGGVLTQNFGWRSLFLVNGFLGALIIMTTIWKLKGEWAEARGERFDWIGSMLAGTTLIAIMLGFPRLPNSPGIVLMSGSLVALILFVWWESRISYPMLDMTLFIQNRNFALSNLAAFLNYAATFAISFLLSLCLQYMQSFTPQRAGLILIAQPVVMAIFSPLAGRLSDRTAPRILASLGMGLITLGLLGFAFLDNTTAVPLIVANLILVGFGYALFSSPIANAIMSSVERRFYGVASATMATMRTTGQVLSLGIAMLIFKLLIGNVRITPEYYPQFMRSVQVAFGVFACVCCLGILAALVQKGNTRNS